MNALSVRKLPLTYHTIKHLKSKQIFFRCYYFLRRLLRQRSRFSYPLSIPSQSSTISLSQSIIPPNSYKNGQFTFLNLTNDFVEEINWNFSDFGKLWTYNLNYFDYLNQSTLSKNEGLSLIESFIKQTSSLKDALEPFPISLRGINWIKFFAHHNINDQKIDNYLYAQYAILIDNLEYHLLGNHLLENGFSLLFGAYYFRNEEFYKKAKKILDEELTEQILDDGAHFELSPMYHQIILFRILDCINLIQNNNWIKDTLLSILREKASLMLGWINIITFKNGNIPLLNDSTNHVAPSTAQLNMYAKQLNINAKHNITLCDCGYRKIIKEKYECIVDVGKIGPDYIPGHAHSDTFNFELYVDGNPIIVDTGVSTYENNKTRIFERSTASHNTVQINGLEQTEVWGSFRVAKRAKVIALIEKKHSIEAIHNGYLKRLGALHQRKFFFSDNCIRIIDNVISKKKLSCVVRFHFHPSFKIYSVGKSIKGTNLSMNLKNNKAEVKVKSYQYSPEFNNNFSAVVLEITFYKHLDIEILL